MDLKSKFFKISIGILLVLVIIYLVFQILPFFFFTISIIKIILYPTMFAVIFYYLFRPLRDFLERYKFPRWLAILFVYLTCILFFVIVTIYIWPYLSKQITEFTSTPKEKIEEIQKKTIDIMDFFNFTSISRKQLEQDLTFYSKQFFKIVMDNMISTLSSIAQIASYFIITPFLLFYLLHDDNKILRIFLVTFPKKYRSITKKIAQEIDVTLSFFINSQIIVAFIVSTLIFIGYSIIGLNYVIILAFIAFIFNIIPFTGPFISTIPALLIGLSTSFSMGIKVIIVVLAVHLLDFNLISPRIVGHKLNIHPITIIFLLICSFPLFGLAGLFLITPLYAILKVIASHLYTYTEDGIEIELQ